MSSLGRTVGAGMTAAAPFLLEGWRAKVDEAEQARMQEWQSSESKLNREHLTKENQLGREFTASEGDKDRALDQQRLEIDEANMDLAYAEFQDVKKQTDLAIESAEMTIADKKAVNGLIEEWDNIDLKDPGAQDKITTIIHKLKGRGLNVASKDWKFFQTEPNLITGEAGYMSRGNTATGEYQILTPSVSGSDDADIKAIMDNNPGKDEAWAKEYLDYLKANGKR